jgi:hypothetical protein
MTDITIHQDARFEVGSEVWAAYEVYANGSIVLVSSARLYEAVNLHEAVRNMELTKLLASSVEMHVRIIATSKIVHQVRLYAQARLTSLGGTPVCNHGSAWLLSGRVQGRGCIASDGRRWATQQECANELGVAQGQVSRWIRTGKPDANGVVYSKIGHRR